MIRFIESFYLSIGKYSCYFDCLVRIAEMELKKRGLEVQYDHNTVVQLCALHKKDGKQYITFNWDDYSDTDNFNVNYAAEILNLLTGLKWGYMRKDSADYKPKPNEYDIRRWNNNGQHHFNMDDYDPLQKSLTVKNGKIDGHRVFYVIE